MQVFFKALFKNPGAQDKAFASFLRILARLDNAFGLFSCSARTGKAVLHNRTVRIQLKAGGEYSYCLSFSQAALVLVKRLSIYLRQTHVVGMRWRFMVGLSPARISGLGIAAHLRRCRGHVRHREFKLAKNVARFTVIKSSLHFFFCNAYLTAIFYYE